MSKYSETLAIIEEGGLLPSDDLQFIKDNISDIQSVWEKRQVFRTDTEMRVSVLNDIKFPTNAAKYWQCVRELSNMYEALVSASFEYRRNLIKIKRLQGEVEKAHGFLRDELQIDLEECLFKQMNMEATAKDRAREIKMWSGMMVELDDGSFDTDDVNAHQLVSYALRFDRQRHEMGDNASPSERANLIGQHQTAMKHLEDRGLLVKSGDKVTAIKASK